MKRFVKRALFMALALCMAFFTAASSALAAGLSPIRDFGASGLTDVPDDWSRPYITTCYELGLMSDRGNGMFAPGGSVSVAEAVTVAARVHDLWRGGNGVLPQGDPWYAGAVDYALENGILTEGQFSDYTVPASRCETAGLLASALPEEDYAAINSVTSLPDVTDATPYADGIFKLYNAGILTGGDVYGTFYPNTSLTRAELAAILCRLVLPDTRQSFTLQEKPQGPAMAYTTDKLLWLANRPVAGMVVIEGEYYYPLELLDEWPLIYNCYGEDSLSIATFSSGALTLVAPTIVTPAGVAIGETQPSDMVLEVGGGTIKNAVRTLGGQYPMVRLSALAEYTGYRDDGVSIALLSDRLSSLPVTWEADLAGQAAAALVQNSPKATMQAYHDYLVNTLTHFWFIDDAYHSKNDPQRYERIEQAYEQYTSTNNQTLASGYGVCQNYAELFQAMCLQAGIPCRIVTGMGNGESHAWNQVWLDGEWLYVDVTFDDPGGSTPTLRQSNFLVGPEAMAVSHEWTGDDYPMPDEYDPAWEQLDPNNITSADMYRKCLVAQLMQKKTSFSLRTTVSGAYGGSSCIYHYPVGFWFIRYGYNSATGTYDYTVEY